MTAEKNIHRYDRQNLIRGWDQEKLTRGIVTIIGSDALARYVALPLAALGVGTIRIIDSSEGEEKDRLLDIPLRGDSRAKTLEDALRRINPEIEVMGINSDLTARAAQYFLEGSDVVVDATNDITSKSHALEYHLRTGTPLFSASSDTTKGKIVMANGDPQPIILMPMFRGAEQGDLVSLELGGVLAEEVKKVLMQQGSPLAIIYNYNLESNERFGFASDRELRETADAFRGKKILMVGAGALGCFLGPATITSMSPGRIDIMDYDTIEDHNLNRQVCFYDAVGRLKAERLAQTLEAMSRGETEIRALVEKFTEEFQPDVEYDLIFDAVDSFFTKAILHNYAKEHGIPIISGGTDYRASTVMVYKPGETSCFDCQINLTELAVKAEIIRRTSCLQAPDPSVIMTNQVAGALMVAEARSVLRPDLYGRPVNGPIRFISDFDSRGGVNELESVCSCHTRGPSRIELPDPERVRIEEREVDGQIVKEVYIDGKRL